MSRHRTEAIPFENTAPGDDALFTFTAGFDNTAIRSPQSSLVAEEVEKVNPDLVVPDKKGKPFTVR